MPPDIALIAAFNNKRAIGKGNALLWCLPRDMRHFREMTLGKSVLMGRKTFESIGRVLPRRMNVILSRQSDFSVDGAVVVPTVEAAVRAADGASELMIIGGAQIYQAFLQRASRLYITHVDNDTEGDAWFPAFDARTFVEVGSTHWEADAENQYRCRFATYERVSCDLRESATLPLDGADSTRVC